MPPKKARAARASIKTEPKPTAASKKRKASASDDDENHDAEAPGPKSRKRNKYSAAAGRNDAKSASSDATDGKIMINRAPVLELWGASVAHFLHPKFSWNLCLGIGNSISTITAISKGRSIGTIAPSDKTTKKKKKAGAEDEEDVPSYTVMGFPMTVKGDSVIVKGKPKQTREANLLRKFGDGNLDRVKSTMAAALETWKGKEEELDREAFHMYEKFRPNVAKGTQGWGRKGELSLSKIKEVVHTR